LDNAIRGCGKMSDIVFTLYTSNGTLYLPMPNWAGTNEQLTNDVKVFNMWTEDIEVVYIELNDESLVLDGTFTSDFYDSYPSDTINSTVEDIWTIQNSGLETTISDLSDCLNGVYVIRSFGFNTIKRTLGFSYELRLQKVRDV